MMRVLDLFSGVGGFSLGLERAGMTTVAFCEIEPFCRRVLAKHWPEVPCYDDIRTLTAERLAADGISVDVICGGFPCQDISVAGKGAGLAGERSGLWREYARLIGEIRPRFVIVENVAALLSRGLGDVLGNLAALGYDAEWHCIPASAVGAPHRRDRAWIVAYADCEWERGGHYHGDCLEGGAAPAPAGTLDACDEVGGACAPVAGSAGLAERPWVQSGWERAYTAVAPYCWWDAEPALDQVVDGFPGRVDQCIALGNAVVPQIPELIGRAIMQAEARHAA